MSAQYLRGVRQVTTRFDFHEGGSCHKLAGGRAADSGGGTRRRRSRIHEDTGCGRKVGAGGVYELTGPEVGEAGYGATDEGRGAMGGTGDELARLEVGEAGLDDRAAVRDDKAVARLVNLVCGLGFSG